MVIAFLSRTIISRKITVVYYDVNLHAPHNIRSKVETISKSILLRCVDGLFCMHKDTSSYEQYFDIDKKKFYYVPFKANNYRFYNKYKSTDGGYALSCGASYRDFDTFLEAVRILGYPTKIVLPAQNTAKHHNTFFEERCIPASVEVIRHDYNRDSWYEYMANARIVVIPIRKELCSPPG